MRGSTDPVIAYGQFTQVTRTVMLPLLLPSMLYSDGSVQVG